MLHKEDIGGFVAGARGRFPTLEEILVDDHKLMVLDSESRTVVKREGDLTVGRHALNPHFKAFMEEYGSQVDYITPAGTPWLTHEQKENNPELYEAYKTAIRKGKNDNLAVMGWRPYRSVTNAGHAWIHFGALAETGTGLTFVGDPESHSLHPLQVNALKDLKHSEIRKETLHDIAMHTSPAHVAGARAADDPSLITMPMGSLAGVIFANILATHIYKGKGKKKNIARDIIPTVVGSAAGGGIGDGAGWIIAIFKNTRGVVTKGQEHGSGAVALLVTPAQRDILQTSLEGLMNTLAGVYNIKTRNCGKFTNEMMEKIGVEIEQVIQDYLEEEGYKDKLRDRVSGSILKRRPDTRRGAFNRLLEERADVTTASGDRIRVATLEVNGHPAVMIEPSVKPDTPNRNMPLFEENSFVHTLDEALGVLRLEPVEDTFRLAFQDRIRTTPVEKGMALSR